MPEAPAVQDAPKRTESKQIRDTREADRTETVGKVRREELAEASRKTRRSRTIATRPRKVKGIQKRNKSSERVRGRGREKTRQALMPLR